MHTSYTNSEFIKEFINIGDMCWAFLGVIWSIWALKLMGVGFFQLIFGTRSRVNAFLKIEPRDALSTCDELVLKIYNDDSTTIYVERSTCDFQLKRPFRLLRPAITSFDLHGNCARIGPQGSCKLYFGLKNFVQSVPEEVIRELKAKYGWMIRFVQASIRTQDDQIVHVNIDKLLKL